MCHYFLQEVFFFQPIIVKVFKKHFSRLGAMAHTCNPSTFGGGGRWITSSRDRDHPGQHGETLSLLKIEKISWAWWRVPVIPATQEAEAGELPEPKRQRLQWAEIAPLHCSLSNKSETPSPKKKKKRKRKRKSFGQISKGLLFPGSLFCSIGLYICLYASTMLSWLLLVIL